MIDPVSLAGLGLGAASITFQIFEGIKIGSYGTYPFPNGTFILDRMLTSHTGRLPDV